MISLSKASCLALFFVSRAFVALKATFFIIGDAIIQTQ